MERGGRQHAPRALLAVSAHHVPGWPSCAGRAGLLASAGAKQVTAERPQGRAHDSECAPDHAGGRWRYASFSGFPGRIDGMSPIGAVIRGPRAPQGGPKSAAAVRIRARYRRKCHVRRRESPKPRSLPRFLSLSLAVARLTPRKVLRCAREVRGSGHRPRPLRTRYPRCLRPGHRRPGNRATRGAGACAARDRRR